MCRRFGVRRRQGWRRGVKCRGTKERREVLKGEENMIKVDTKALKNNVKGAALTLNSDGQAFKSDGEVLNIKVEALKWDGELLKDNEEKNRR